MSGEHFQYEQYKIQMIADEVEQLIIDNNSDEKDQWGDVKGYHFNLATIAEFKECLRLLKLAHVYAQRIDWLVSGDDGEDSFHARLRAELSELEARK